MPGLPYSTAQPSRVVRAGRSARSDLASDRGEAAIRADVAPLPLVGNPAHLVRTFARFRIHEGPVAPSFVAPGIRASASAWRIARAAAPRPDPCRRRTRSGACADDTAGIVPEGSQIESPRTTTLTRSFSKKSASTRFPVLANTRAVSRTRKTPASVRARYSGSMPSTGFEIVPKRKAYELGSGRSRLLRSPICSSDHGELAAPSGRPIQASQRRALTRSCSFWSTTHGSC